jgi:hypothetical protein
MCTSGTAKWMKLPAIPTAMQPLGRRIGAPVVQPVSQASGEVRKEAHNYLALAMLATAVIALCMIRRPKQPNLIYG